MLWSVTDASKDSRRPTRKLDGSIPTDSLPADLPRVMKLHRRHSRKSSAKVTWRSSSIRASFLPKKKRKQVVQRVITRRMQDKQWSKEPHQAVHADSYSEANHSILTLREHSCEVQDDDSLSLIFPSTTIRQRKNVLIQDLDTLFSAWAFPRAQNRRNLRGGNLYPRSVCLGAICSYGYRCAKATVKYSDLLSPAHALASLRQPRITHPYLSIHLNQMPFGEHLAIHAGKNNVGFYSVISLATFQEASFG